MSADPGSAVAEFEQLLVSNSGEDAFLVAVRLLSAKLVDELAVRQGSTPRFVLGGDIQALHNEAILNFPEIDGLRGELGLTADQLTRCLRPLLGWSILDSDLAHLDAVLERLVAPEAKGALGQYFTPREVIRLCVRALDPRPSDTVIDPACGSGGFLYEAVRHSVDEHGDAPRCLGIDLGARSITLAQLLSHTVADGAIRVHRGNSLDARGFDAKAVGQSFGELRCSLLFANPPFAGDIDDPEVLAHYTAHREAFATTKRSSIGRVGREHLFVERAVQLLEPGGRLAIVVPQGVLANSSAAYLRRWFSARCRVRAVIGLHPHAFLPHTGVKTSILFLERPRTGSPPVDYPVFFAVSRAPGKDGSGRRSGGDDLDEIGRALGAFLATGEGAETVPMAELAKHDRLDAEYWDSTSRGAQKQLEARATRRLGEVVARTVSRIRREGSTLVDYIDISCVDARTGVATPTTMMASETPSRATWLVVPGDVLVSTVRPERNVVALVDRASPRPLVASNGFCVLRPDSVAPEVVYAFCKTTTFRKLLVRHATATMYPAVTDRDVLDLPFVEPRSEVARAIVASVRAAFERFGAARRDLEHGIDEMEKVLTR